MASGATALKDTKTDRPAHITEEEWDLRQQLAAAYRVFDHLGWTLVIFNHLTARVPGPDHHFLINPFGLRYDEVTASNLVKIDLEGNKVDDSPYGVNPAGFVIHSGIHSAVPEAHCIMHTHTTEGLAVSMKKDGLRNENFYTSMIGDNVAYHDFEGITEREDEKPRLLASMGNKPFLVLRNHGLLTHGRTVAEAFVRMWTLQLACEAQVLADSMQGENIPVSPEATRVSTETARLVGSNEPVGKDMFEALVRVVDEKDPSYRT